MPVSYRKTLVFWTPIIFLPMTSIPCNRDQLVSVAKFSDLDLDFIKQCRHNHAQLGFAYQLAHVRLFNIFPNQKPFEVNQEILAFVSLQLGVDVQLIDRYSNRQPTISEHQEIIRIFFGLRLFNSAVIEVESHAFKLSYSLEQTGAITVRLREYLKANHILDTCPGYIAADYSDSTSSGERCNLWPNLPYITSNYTTTVRPVVGDRR